MELSVKFVMQFLLPGRIERVEEMMHVIDRCPLCSGRRFCIRPGSVRDRADLQILECQDCGLVFLSSRDHITEDFYKNAGMHGSALPSVKEWLQETEEDDERRFRQFLYAIQGKVIVDFGCGAGGFLLRARKVAKKVYGIELEKRLQTHFSSSGLSVFEDIGKLPEKPDLIFMFHVLEHVAEPLPLLERLRQTGARLIVEVPNADDALLTLYHSEAFSHFTYWSPHLYLYNAGTLPRLLKKAGYQVVYVRQYQRYPLSNHLYWLAKGKPGGHKIWPFFNSAELEASYSAALGAIGKCDTILAEFCPEGVKK